MFPCSLKQGSCSLVPYDIFPLFPCSPKPLGDPHFCSNYKKWFIWYNCEHYYCKYTTKSHFSHHSVDHIFHSLNSKGGLLPANDSCNLPWACLNERLSYINCSFACLLYTSPSPRDLSTSRMPSSA